MTDEQALAAVPPDDIARAAERLAGVVHRTPVVTSRALDEATGGRVFLKSENLQRVGAFKIRGAYNAMSRLSAESARRGVLAFSSGNHAQGVALAGRLLGISTTIVMPVNAPAVKRVATEGYGAEVILYDPASESREEIGRRLADERGMTLIPPYDHPDVIAGQGTAALELFEEVPDLDLLLVPCGGGGLLSGCALAARLRAPACRVIGVEPELADDATRSFRTGILQHVDNPPTIADGTRTPCLGRYTFPLVRTWVSNMATVTEEAICEAVRFLLARTKLLVEPSGALGVAALRSETVSARGLRVGVILSGGNVDPATLARLLVE